MKLGGRHYQDLNTNEPLPDEDKWIDGASIKVNDSPWTPVPLTLQELTHHCSVLTVWDYHFTTSLTDKLTKALPIITDLAKTYPPEFDHETIISLKRE